MDSAPLQDLDELDREALKALLVQHQEQLLSGVASYETELESHRQTLSQQDEQLRSSSEQIEHLELVIEKLRRRGFGVKSEKIVVQLEQLELHLEELESSQADQKHVLAGTKLHADDTPVPVLAPGSSKTKTGRLWTYVRDDRPAGEDTAPAVWFAYSEDRKDEHPRKHLKNFKGGLQADACAGFHHLYDDGAIDEVACWAHARRKFHEILVLHASPTTTEALASIGALYAIEDEVRGKPADLRMSVRLTRAKPLLDD